MIIFGVPFNEEALLMNVPKNIAYIPMAPMIIMNTARTNFRNPIVLRSLSALYAVLTKGATKCKENLFIC
jgi:hypothetical protein